MTEKRQFIRRPADSEYTVWDRIDNYPIGQVVNLSKNGIKLRTEKSYEINSYLLCILDLPEKLKGRDRVVFDLVIKWCNKVNTKTGELYEIGCRLLNVSKADREAIDALTHLWMANHSDAMNKSSVVIKKN